MASPSLLVHICKNISLLLLSLLLLPLTSAIALSSLLYTNLFPVKPTALWVGERKTILVSSLAMCKGLCIARALHLSGHRVIGVDVKRLLVPSAGRFSASLSAYYEVDYPKTPGKAYERQIVEIVKKEGVDVWICVSDIATTVEDALAKETVEAETGCKVFIPSVDACRAMDDKHSFIEHAEGIGLQVPETVLVASGREALEFLKSKTNGKQKFILKSVAIDDETRSDMTLLFPRVTWQDTESRIGRLPITPDNPWVIQEFISGAEYCSHAAVVNGVVTAFVACPSSDLLMSYRPLPLSHPAASQLLDLTREHARTLDGGRVTGQLAFDVLLADDGRGVFPIECNPRTHTAVVLFSQTPAALAEAYLSLLNPRHKEPALVDCERTRPVYWLGHDIVSLILAPVLLHFRLPDVKTFITHLLFWKDGIYEVWDPLPMWWLYHVYWPAAFIESLYLGKRWSRVNVSTTRIFGWL